MITALRKILLFVSLSKKRLRNAKAGLLLLARLWVYGRIAVLVVDRLVPLIVVMVDADHPVGSVDDPVVLFEFCEVAIHRGVSLNGFVWPDYECSRALIAEELARYAVVHVANVAFADWDEVEDYNVAVIDFAPRYSGM